MERLSDGLRANGHEVVVFAPDYEGQEEEKYLIRSTPAGMDTIVLTIGISLLRKIPKQPLCRIKSKFRSMGSIVWLFLRNSFIFHAHSLSFSHLS